VGEVESAGPGVPLQGFQNEPGWREGRPSRLTLVGFVCLPERSRIP
jgi:hypothetical protein